MIKNNFIYIAITFDAEVDAFDSSLGLTESPAFDGIEQGSEIVFSILHDIQVKNYCKISPTWFVRCDDQIKYLLGNNAELLIKYDKLWNYAIADGHEIGFHPHLYKQRDHGWTQDLNEISLEEQVLRSHRSAYEAGYKLTSSRIGEAYACNSIMSTLDKIGYTIDSTAMPGRMRLDNERSFNWKDTPQSVYNPSVDNYQIPGWPKYNLKEVPMSMVNTLADYDAEPFSRYLDLTFHTRAIEKSLPKLVRSSNLVVTVSHLSAVLQNKKSHGLISFDALTLKQNIQLLIDVCIAEAKVPVFIPLKSIPQYIENGSLTSL